MWGLLKRQHLLFHSYYITVISPLLPMGRYQLSQVSEAECLRSVFCNERKKKKVTEEKGAAKKKDHSGVGNLICHFTLNAIFFALLLLFWHVALH